VNALNGSIRLGRILGVEINLHFSWFMTVVLITTLLAVNFYPETFPPRSPYRDDRILHWGMAAASGLVFFASILAHELAHSLVARKQGIKVRGITLFVFGGMAQITGDAKRPLHEFVMAIVGPLTSIVMAGAFLLIWIGLGGREDRPLDLIFEWLFIMNLGVGIFNLAPAFPMDGGRVLRAVLWGISHSFVKATRWSTLLGQGLGYAMMALGGAITFGAIPYFDVWNGFWFIVLGFFLQSSARTSWFQVQALQALARHRAGDLMSRDLETIGGSEVVKSISERTVGRQRFLFFVYEDDRVIGALTEKQAATPDEHVRDVMVPAEKIAVASLEDDGATVLQLMENEDVWHVPVIAERRVVGVVSKDNLLRIIAAQLLPKPGLSGPRP
jgi:Zn-dependent protease/predicted transcriptional regulator